MKAAQICSFMPSFSPPAEVMLKVGKADMCPTLLTQALADVKPSEEPSWWDCANTESPRHQV